MLFFFFLLLSFEICPKFQASEAEHGPYQGYSTVWIIQIFRSVLSRKAAALGWILPVSLLLPGGRGKKKRIEDGRICKWAFQRKRRGVSHRLSVKECSPSPTHTHRTLNGTLSFDTHGPAQRPHICTNSWTKTHVNAFNAHANAGAGPYLEVLTQITNGTGCLSGARPRLTPQYTKIKVLTAGGFTGKHEYSGGLMRKMKRNSKAGYSWEGWGHLWESDSRGAGRPVEIYTHTRRWR